MNVLELLQSVAAEVGTAIPSAYNSNNLLLNLFYATNRDLRSSRAFPQQKRKHTITLSTTSRQYQLPQDFYSGLLGTQYNQTDEWQLIGPLSDAQFNYVLYGPGSVSIRDQYRIFGMDSNPNSAGGQLEFAELPSDTDTISFEYISKTTILPPNWQPSTVYTSGDYVNANGKIYLCDTNGTSSTTAPSGTGDDETDGTTQWDYVATPYEKALSDSDLPLFDEELLILGITWRYLRQKKEDFSVEYQEYKTKISKAVGRWTGPTVVRGDQVSGGILLPRVKQGSWTI